MRKKSLLLQTIAQLIYNRETTSQSLDRTGGLELLQELYRIETARIGTSYLIESNCFQGR